MRKLLPILTIAAAAALVTPALAAPYYSAVDENANYAARYTAPVAGAAVGTAVGVGLYNAWWGSTAAVIALPATAAGAAAVGGVAGVGTVVLIDAAVQPCRGFQALLTMNRDQCVNGEYVGYAPHRHMRQSMR
ncbi:MAG TPA: hypothetical protein VII24_07155 [Pseudolabrys sp.]